MRPGLIVLYLLSCCTPAATQIIRISPAGDTTRSVSIEGYADVYFGFDLNQPKDGNRLYAVSQSRHDEVNLNLAYLSIKYSAERARATFAPGFGTYMNANYAAERLTLRNVVEANVGVKPFKRRDIWVDAGIFAAPYTTESALAHDQLLYTRSLGAEYSPYYLSGIRATLPLGKCVTLLFYFVNGWQVIEDVNTSPSFGSSLEWKPSGALTVNWSTYAGNEQAALQPQYKGRYFSDLYAVYTPNKKLTLAADVYAGRQKLTDSITRKNPVSWYQGNISGRYRFTASQSVAARLEYFHDAHAVLVVPVTGLSRFDCGSFSIGYHVSVTGNVSFHAEGRYFLSGDEVFLDDRAQPSSHTTFFVGGLTAKF